MMIKFGLFLAVITAVAANDMVVLKVMEALTHRSLPGCFNDVQLPETFKQHRETCIKQESIKKVLMELRENQETPNLDSLKNVIQDIRACLGKEMAIVDAEGKIMLDKWVLMFDDFEGDQEKIAALKNISQNCASGLDSASLTAKELNFQLMRCELESQLNYCTEIGENIGRLDLIVALMTLQDQSPCKVVKVKQEVEKFAQECLPNDADTEGSPKIRTGRPGRPSRHVKMDLGLRRRFKCVAEKGGYYTEAEGHNFTVLADLVASFPGWDTIPELRDQVVADIMACGANSTVEAAEQHKQKEDRPLLKNRPTHSVQMMMFMKCLMPPFSKTCGMRNQVSMLLFPPFIAILPESIKEEIKNY